MAGSATGEDRRRDGRAGGRVEVLGRTTVGGEEVTGRQRAILAALAFHHRGATTGTLIDAVWGDEPPRAARQSLHNQITRLRRRFGPDLVHTELDCYRLGQEPDVVRFERLAAPWAHGPVGADAVAPLRGALELWRGTPYLDLPDHHHAVAPERVRLAELRSRSMERLALSLLATGDPRTAAVELRRLLDDEPYREDTWALLMVALHRDGRRAEALATYDEVADRLEQEMGVRPGASLQRLAAEVATDGAIDLTALHQTGPPVPSASTCDHHPTVHRRCADHRRARPTG